ncbi:MAG: Gfo/Idh/MocA family protein, partial [Armatimonadota bacterium]
APNMALKQDVAEGRIGDVEFLRMRNGTMNARETAPSYGGALMDIGAHGIDLIRALTGQEIARVSARLGQGDASDRKRAYSGGDGRPNPDRVLLGNEVNAWMQYELSGGTVVSHEVQWSQTAGTFRFQVEVYGTQGTIFLRVPRTGEDLAIASGAEKRPDFVVPELPGRPMGQALHEELIRSVATGEWNAQVGEDGVAVLRVCEAARRADEGDCWVDVLWSSTEVSFR